MLHNLAPRSPRNRGRSRRSSWSGCNARSERVNRVGCHDVTERTRRISRHSTVLGREGAREDRAREHQGEEEGHGRSIDRSTVSQNK